jgi:hypothetical protein
MPPDRGNIVHNRPPTFTPEFDLVVSCARLERGESDVEDVRSLLTPTLDWTSVLGLAQRHGLTSFVHRAIGTLTPASVPWRTGRALERRAAEEVRRNARLRTTLGALLERFAASGIPLAPLRCSRLTRALGETIELDLLVRRSDLTATWSLMAAAGFPPEMSSSPEQARALIHTHGSRRFVDAGGTVVSIQWRVADRRVDHGPSVDELWRRASAGRLAGHPCLLLDPVDLLLLGCVRGTIKRWQRVLWIREIAEIMAEATAVDLVEALADATRSGARHALALGASLAARLIGAPLPPRLAEAARAAAVADLERGVLADLTAAARPLAGPDDIARFHLRSRERLRDKLRYTVRRATVPGPDDVGSSRLPARLQFLNGALVPWRRAMSAGRQWLRRRSPVRGRHIARFVPTPPHVVDRMLAIAGVTPSDRLLDLGCGDGAIVIRAAQRVGCRGVGVDLEAELIATARDRARAAGLDGLVEFHHGDARAADLSTPTVVCIYLSANLDLRPYLQRGLQPGARLVSFNFDMGDWIADEVDVIDEAPWGSNTLYLWRIGEAADGQSAA